MKSKPKISQMRSFLIHFRGFTMIELLVVVTVLGVLVMGVIVAINPSKQREKANDSKRLANIAEIRNALNLFYNDTGCFPNKIGSPFVAALEAGSEWKEGPVGQEAIYMKKVPKDPSSGSSYVYITDSSTCPQWGTVFAQLSMTQATPICSLSSSSAGGASCVPTGYNPSWACVTAGNTNCSVISQSALGGLGPITVATPTDIAPTLPTSGGSEAFTVSMNNNPQFYKGTLAPMYPVVGANQKLSIIVIDPLPVVSVSAKIYTDTKIKDLPLVFESGTKKDGTWAASWTFNDTINTKYKIVFTATDGTNTSSIDVMIK